MNVPHYIFINLQHYFLLHVAIRFQICLGLQELPQLEEQYGKATAKTITSIIGNTLSGQAKAPETLDWLQNYLEKLSK